jgi:hypothetical protein
MKNSLKFEEKRFYQSKEPYEDWERLLLGVSTTVTSDKRNDSRNGQ